MKKLVVLIFVLQSFSYIFSQHLPLKIGNQWHYNTSLAPIGSHVAIATDTVTINNKKYFRIENWSIDGSQLQFVTFDRMVWDSTYFRLNEANQEYLLFNFKWPDNFIYSTQSIYDTSCIDLLLIYKYLGQIWNIYSDFYTVFFGHHCPGWQDTSWTLSSYSIAYSFGSIDGFDGKLVGAKINGITYGTLHPLPVELLSFSSTIVDDDVTLNWITATETNNSGFNIERCVISTEGKNLDWKSISFINGYGTTTEPQSYHYKDENLPAEKYQYRLKQIDFDGTFEYSNIIEVEINQPTKFSLEQNYPNPFNPSTKIKFTISTPPASSPLAKGRNEVGFVTLKVYDVLGTEVATLVNEEKPAGTYEVQFNATTLTTGVYFYRLQAGNFIQTKKMTILK